MVVANTPAAWDERAKEPESWQAAMWSKEGQEARFEAVARRLRLREGQTVLDYGCGTGRFREWLPAGVHYYGYDWSKVMRERARASGATILRRLDQLRFDHVVAIGTFNLADSWSKDKTGEELLDLWMRHTDKSLTVCLYRGTDLECIPYSPAEAAIWAGRFTKRYLIDADYLDNDFLVTMRR